MKDNMDIGLPEKLELHEHPDYIHITRKWFGSQIVFLTAFAIFWNFFLVNFYAGMGEHADTFTMFLPLLHVGVGVCITYYVIAGWLNKSNVFLSKHTIEINHKPIPWFGNTKFKSTDLKQLYAKEKVTNKRNGTTVTYEVHAILKNKKNIKLLSGLESSEQALFIEQEIENFLQIENTPVRGEIG
jgi:hypothetical protein